ncbi:MAG: fumarate reductase/succinate dehydrogenase flavoprotein subunit [Planctomycetota bacterium]|nr:fumarate reductase/succinate dehydrogenase flavoprotein subunit [Planctomycetota bacterium]
MKLDSKIPSGPLAEKWDKHRFGIKLVNPASKRKFHVLVVGTGLAGASAAATLAELGYSVDSFCSLDSPRRAHSIAAQGGINGAKNYQNDGDSVWRLFYDTIKGGDYRSREANIYRLAQVSNNVIDQCIAQGVPFAREYGGTLKNRSFGGAQVSRTFYARGQTGQQLLLGAYGALSRQIQAGQVRCHTRTEMLDLVVVDGHARGIMTRDLLTGEIECWAGDAVVLATGGYSNVFQLSTNAIGCNVTATYRAYRRGAGFANPGFVQIHPTCIPVSGDYQSKLTLMSESLRNDGRIWVPRSNTDTRHPNEIPESERDYYLERKYPAFGNLVPRDIASRECKAICDQGRGVGTTGRGVYLDFKDAMARIGEETLRARYGNLFHMYHKITAENPYKEPMRIYPAAHFTMGGLWVDYNLMSTVPGLFVIGEANFSDHGANRLGANSLLQGLADGYFILPYTIGDYFASHRDKARIGVEHSAFSDSRAEVQKRIQSLLSVKGKQSSRSFHKRLGEIMGDHCAMARSAEGLNKAIDELAALKEEFWSDLCVTGTNEEYNVALQYAGQVADFLNFAPILCHDALAREESCGAHFRKEHINTDGGAKRDDENFAHVSVWEYQGDDQKPVLHKETLEFESVVPSTRSYE